MTRPFRTALAAAATLTALTLTGCSAIASATTTAANVAAGQLPIGPGPQSHYRIQPQPAPGTCRYQYTNDQPLPDQSCTPGAVSPAVTQANLRQTICRSGGYTAGIRPPVSVTSPEKRANARSYGYGGYLGDAEYDHLVSLELGGDPNDPQNLWVEPPSPGHRHGSGVNNPKDTIENDLHSAVCSGRITLAAAQHAIASNWTTAEQVLGLRKSTA